MNFYPSRAVWGSAPYLEGKCKEWVALACMRVHRCKQLVIICRQLSMSAMPLSNPSGSAQAHMCEYTQRHEGWVTQLLGRDRKGRGLPRVTHCYYTMHACRSVCVYECVSVFMRTTCPHKKRKIQSLLILLSLGMLTLSFILSFSACVWIMCERTRPVSVIWILPTHL